MGNVQTHADFKREEYQVRLMIRDLSCTTIEKAGAQNCYMYVYKNVNVKFKECHCIYVFAQM